MSGRQHDHHVLTWLRWLYDIDRNRYTVAITARLALLVDGNIVRVRMVR